VVLWASAKRGGQSAWRERTEVRGQRSEVGEQGTKEDEEADSGVCVEFLPGSTDYADFHRLNVSRKDAKAQSTDGGRRMTEGGRWERGEGI